MSDLVCFPASEVARLLIGVDVPHDVVRQAVDSVSCALGHLGESLGLCLVLKGVGGEVDAYRVISATLFRLQGD